MEVRGKFIRGARNMMEYSFNIFPPWKRIEGGVRTKALIECARLPRQCLKLIQNEIVSATQFMGHFGHGG